MDSSSKPMPRTTLNPHAAEFVPKGLKLLDGKASSVTNNVPTFSRNSPNKLTESDDERQKFWQDQLPDDLTPEFEYLSETVDDRLEFQQLMLEENAEIDPINLLVNEFPSFGAESLADIYSANNGDLGLTIEMLTQLELQDEAGSSRFQLQSSSSPRLDMMDFPALSGSELPNGSSLNEQESQSARSTIGIESLFTVRPYGAGDSRGATDFADVVRKNATSPWQSDRNKLADHGFGTFRTSPQSLEGGLQAGDFRGVNGEVFSRRHSQAATPIWLETGEAVSNVYADLREEARDHARVRNAYFEQARRAYLSGNKALAKDLSAKGQMYNGLMKEAHKRAGEAIFRQRNSSIGGFSQGQSQLLDLHGLHVSEAIPLLKRELEAIRLAARSTQQRQQVFICVGTGHHTKGARTPARLPVAVEKFLVENEHHFTEQQPGMLRVVVS